MKTLKLITTDPLQFFNKSINGFPATYQQKDGTDAPTPPDGWAYVEVLDMPVEDPAAGKVWSRNLTATTYGWVEVDEPYTEPEWYELPAWRVRAIADVTPHGGGMLIDSVTAAIDAIVDDLERSVAKEVFFGGNTLRRDSALLTSMAAGLGLAETDLDTLFQQAFAITV